MSTTEAPPSPLARRVALNAQKRELEASLRTVREELATVDEQLLEQFAEQGVTSQKHALTGATVYTSRRIWARPADGVDKPAACTGLQGAGLGDYVESSFNTNSLSAHFRELAKQWAAEHGGLEPELDQLLPAELRGVIALTEDWTVGVRQ